MIAIVDDYEAVRKGLQSLLRSMGHNASTFDSAEDFLGSEKLHDTSCLITDVQMPGLTGVELQDRLIAEGLRIPIIFMTAYSDENIRARAMRVGAVGYLLKPVDPRHLTGCIEIALQAA